MIGLMRSELLKLRTTQVWFWLLVATVAVSALLVVAQLAGHTAVKTSSDVPNMLTASATSYVVVYVLGVLGVTTEFRYQTITSAVLITPSRWAIVSVKMITYALVGIAFALIATAVELAVALPWLAAKNISVDWNGQVVHALVAVVVVVAIFGIIGLGFGALLRNQIVGIVVGLIFLLVLENLLLAIPWVDNAYPYTPGAAANSLLTVTGSRSVNGVELLPVAGAVVVLLLWALVPAIVGAAFTMNRDIT